MSKLPKYRKRIAKKADNPFTAFTGLPVTKLTGKNAPECWICHQERYLNVAVKKISYITHHKPAWKAYIKQGRREMNLLTVKGTCGINECVNPSHLTATEKEYNPWA